MTPYLYFVKRRDVKMSHHADILLDILRYEGNSTVGWMIAKSKKEGIASLATTHRELIWLKDHGYIRVDVDAKDNRNKICKISKKGLNYLEDL